MLKEKATNEAISGCAGGDGTPSGVLLMKIALIHCQKSESADSIMVFEANKKIPGLEVSTQTWGCRTGWQCT